ncbi:hypothetical protein D9M68_996180 [compost metagenome]
MASLSFSPIRFGISDESGWPVAGSEGDRSQESRDGVEKLGHNGLGSSKIAYRTVFNISVTPGISAKYVGDNDDTGVR